MNKYELCVVLSAKLDDEERAAAIEKIKGFITRYNVLFPRTSKSGERRDWLMKFST